MHTLIGIKAEMCPSVLVKRFFCAFSLRGSFFGEVGGRSDGGILRKDGTLLLPAVGIVGESGSGESESALMRCLRGECGVDFGDFGPMRGEDILPLRGDENDGVTVLEEDGAERGLTKDFGLVSGGLRSFMLDLR